MTRTERQQRALRHPVQGGEDATELVAHGLHLFELTPGLGGEQMGLLSALTVRLHDHREPQWVASCTCWLPDPWRIIPIPTEAFPPLRWLLDDLLLGAGEGETEYRIDERQTLARAIRPLTDDERLRLHGGH